jgi:RNA polymerase subunit RPABC4/transcription elongation factor Spt4
MGLRNCRECGREVSNRAKTCPSCGISRPAKKSATLKDWIGLFAILIFLGVWLGAGSDEEDPTANASAAISAEQEVDVAAQSSAAEAAQKAEAARVEEAACRADIQCWGDKHSIQAGFRCEPFVERMAKYTMEWTDGWLEPKFGYFRWKSQSEGTVTYIGDKARFQNGFGAWSNVRYECDFDPVEEVVLDVRVQ